MRERCLSKTNKRFKDYGGRGITIDPTWDSFENFLVDMGECPQGLTIERLNNDAGYGPENCAWRSRKDQNNNKRSNRLIEFNGEVRNVT